MRDGRPRVPGHCGSWVRWLACVFNVSLTVFTVWCGVVVRTAFPDRRWPEVARLGGTAAERPPPFALAGRPASGADLDGRKQARLAESYGRLPLSFAPIPAQTAGRVKFLARGDGYALSLTSTEVALTLRAPGAHPAPRLETGNSNLGTGKPSPEFRIQKSEYKEHIVLRMRLVGADRDAEIVGFDELAGSTHYLIGNDPKKWRTGVPNFARVRGEGVYPGVDLIYYGNQRQLEYDFIVSPRANPGVIRLAFDGVSRGQPVPLRIDSGGDLVLNVQGREVRWLKPRVYQVLAGKQRNVAAQYVQKGSREFGFAVATYDPTQPLVIDPVLSYSTYLGGTGYDYANSIAVDSSGNAYVTGFTYGLDFPTANAFQASNRGAPEAFVAKLNAAGTALVYSTYLGGSGEDNGLRVRVDTAGNAYVAGYTNSTDFPTASALQASSGGGYDAFLAKLNASGSGLVYSTYLGGSGDDYAYGLALDSSGAAYLAGFTSSPNFPIAAGAIQSQFGVGPYKAFVAKIAASGSTLTYSTYLGGEREDYAAGIAVDASQAAYVTGYTNSASFPTVNALQLNPGGGACGGAPCFDAFVMKLNPGGSAIVYSTYLGGEGGDYGYDVVVDSTGNAYVTGYTTSAHFPVTTGGFQPVNGGVYDAFVTKFNATGSGLVYSTYLGGQGAEVGYGIAVDSGGQALITGYTSSTNFPLASPLQVAIGGLHDAFVTRLNDSGSTLTFSTHLGGSLYDDGRGIAADSSGNAYVAGGTFSTDFPTTPGALQRVYGDGAYDAFITKIPNLGTPVASLSTNLLRFLPQRVATSSEAQTVTLANNGDALLSIQGISASGDFSESHDCGSGLTVGQSCTVSVTFTPTAAGSRTGTLSVTDNATGSPQTVTLSGTGVTSSVSLSPTSLTFSSQTVGTTSTAQTLTLTNTGSAALAITSVGISGDFAETDNCGSPVAAGGNCTLSVSFTPTATGTRIGTVTITDDASDSPQAISLTGTGTAAPATVSLSPTSITFANQPLGGTSAAQAVTLSNTGGSALTIVSISAAAPFAQTNNCGTDVAAGSSCTISVTFTPTATGTQSGTLTVTDNAANSPQAMSLTGTGIAPVVSLTPASVAFGNQQISTTSAAPAVTLANTGTAPLTISSIGITGINSGDFGQTNNCGASLAAGASCIINVTFTPTATGTRTGVVTVTDSASDSPQAVSLTGTGTAAAVVSLSPTSLTFAGQTVGTTSGAQTSTLTNSGGSALIVTSIVARGDFAQTNNCGGSVAAGASCTINVTFTPTATGTRTGAVTVTDNASDSPQALSLTGTAAASAATLSPSSLTFASQAVGTTSAAQAVMLTNGTDSALTIGSVAVTGMNSGDFAQTNGCGASLAVGASCTVNVAFTPIASGSRTGLISIIDNAQGGSQQVALSGMGADFSLLASPNSVDVTAGQIATYALSLAPVGGFNQSVSLSCSGAPSAATCTVAPSSVTSDGTNNGTATVRIATTAPSIVCPPVPVGPSGFGRGVPGLFLFTLLTLALLAVTAGHQRGRLHLVVALAALVLMSAMLACGGGGGGDGSRYAPPVGTPAGTYTLTVAGSLASGSATLTHNVRLTLVVK